MKVHSLVELLIVLPETRSAEEAIKEIERVLGVYGFDYYRIVHQIGNRQSAEIALLGQKWPEKWVKLYSAKNYAKNDPLLRHLPDANRPFRWRDYLESLKENILIPRVERMVNEAAEHGLEDGYVFPVHGSNGVLGRLSIGGKPVDLSPVEISLFDAVAKAAFWHLLDLRNKAQPSKANPLSKAWLTPRQSEILNYLAEGLTSVEIAQRLNISNHTVDWYMTGLQGKLKARNRQHAVALAFRHGLL